MKSVKIRNVRRNNSRKVTRLKLKILKNNYGRKKVTPKRGVTPFGKILGDFNFFSRYSANSTRELFAIQRVRTSLEQGVFLVTTPNGLKPRKKRHWTGNTIVSLSTLRVNSNYSIDRELETHSAAGTMLFRSNWTFLCLRGASNRASLLDLSR